MKSLILILLLNGTLWATPSPRLVLTAQENGVQSDSEFMCTGTIHGYLVLPEQAIDQHELEGIWIMPNGKVAEETKVTLNFPPPGRRTAYVWLAFPTNHSGILGSLNPQSDAERLSYNGRWILKINWDQKPLLQKQFDVRCI